MHSVCCRDYSWIWLNLKKGKKTICFLPFKQWKTHLLIVVAYVCVCLLDSSVSFHMRLLTEHIMLPWLSRPPFVRLGICRWSHHVGGNGLRAFILLYFGVRYHLWAEVLTSQDVRKLQIQKPRRKANPYPRVTEANVATESANPSLPCTSPPAITKQSISFMHTQATSLAWLLHCLLLVQWVR